MPASFLVFAYLRFLGPGSRKRTPLPPQDEAFFPGPRLAPGPRGGGPPSGPAVPENRHAGRVVIDDALCDSAWRSPSPPPPEPRPPPAERGDHDRGRSRWSRPQPNGPSHTERNMHESARGRARDNAMDVDDAPLPRSSDPPPKQIPPRRPAIQDDVPRYPRAMLNQDNDGAPRGMSVVSLCSFCDRRVYNRCSRGPGRDRFKTPSRRR